MIKIDLIECWKNQKKNEDKGMSFIAEILFSRESFRHKGEGGVTYIILRLFFFKSKKLDKSGF